MSEQFKDKHVLLAALKKNDQSAFEYLYRTYFTMVASYIQKNNGSSEDARDMFQEVLFVFYKKVSSDPNFELTSEIGTYLYSIAQNLWLNQLKKKNTVVYMEDTRILPDSADDTNSEEAQIENETKYKSIAEALAAMKQECRDVIEAAFYKKLSGEEIAKLLGYTESFVKVKKFRCLEELRKKVLFKIL
jgi:RNA polymerase sigma factor (sigma-70 family)